jgi:hypothetical protein
LTRGLARVNWLIGVLLVIGPTGGNLIKAALTGGLLVQRAPAKKENCNNGW